METLISQQSRCISHEIKNQISICELYTQIIKRNLEKECFENYSVDNALNCISKSLKIMTNSLIDLKSLDNFSPKNYDLRTILEQGVKLSEVYICEKNIEISTNLNETAMVYIDENKFLACIVNIIKNAIESIENCGKIVVSLEIKNNFAFIKIANNGTPIPKEKQNTIFEEGFTTKPRGSGLGLYICSKNLKAQNAELSLVKSTPEITEFKITLPVV